MTLPAFFESKDDAPEPIREHLQERDGKFYVDVQGMKTEADFNSFSSALQKRLADATDQLKAVRTGALDKESARELFLEVAKTLKGAEDAGGGGDDGDSSAVADLRRELAQLREQHEQDKQARAESDAKLAQQTVTAQLTTATSESGALSASAGTLTNILRNELELTSDGEARTKETSEFGANLTPSELVAKVKVDPRYGPFWPASKGGGADAGGDGGGGVGGDNPWKKGQWNVTKQGQIMQQDMDTATKMAKAAGVDVMAVRPAP